MGIRVPPKLAAFNLPINQKKKCVELSQRKDEILESDQAVPHTRRDPLKEEKPSRHR
jgi:hypothetical protein